jgi:hypothetical protein
MSNRILLKDLADMSPADVAAVPTEQLLFLLDDLEEEKALLKIVENRLRDGVATRYATQAADIRKGLGKDSGTVRVTDGEFVIVANLPKKVSWDQAELTRIVAMIRNDWNMDPAEFLTVKYDMPESRFKALPPTIAKQFEAARTFETGRESFSIERRSEKDAA